MKSRRLLVVAAAVAVGIAAHGSSVAADLGFSLSIGEPGFFGRLDVGDYQPQLINRKPLVIERTRSGPAPAPVYLRVHPGEERDWKRHCHDYNACNAPVYFVRDDWYRNQYVPQYRERHGAQRREEGRNAEQNANERRDTRPEERRDDRRDERPGSEAPRDRDAH